MTIRLRDSDKPTGGLLGVQPLPPMSATAPGLAPHEGVRVPGSVSSPPEGGAAAAATSPALQLTGIIDGDPRMAVIEGETAHYIVREGDRVAGGYRVASISPQKVMLRSEDNRTVVLRFGRKGG
ncbi:MAG TPA: general secretion pathway protein GspB [Armatimonadetes bacterium]|nr:general secretion pathway protein GspB [Armatimonadota bacterium]